LQNSLHGSFKYCVMKDSVTTRSQIPKFGQKRLNISNNLVEVVPLIR